MSSDCGLLGWNTTLVGGYNVSEAHSDSIFRVALTLKIDEAYSSDMLCPLAILHIFTTQRTSV
jgi:hypothetical protein